MDVSTLGRRLRPLAVAAVLVVAGCAETIDGAGSASPGSSTGSSRSGGFPSGTTSGTAPSSGSAVGGLITDEAGHFQVRMPGTPRRVSEPGSFGGYSFTVHIAALRSPYIAIVEGEVITPALPSDQLDAALRAAVTSFQSSSQLDLISQQGTTYQGHTARTAVLSARGTQYQLLVIGYSGTQIYLLFAPKGARFADLLASFRPI